MPLLPDAIFARSLPGETRLALVAKGEILEFAIDRGPPGPGDIALGRVIGAAQAARLAFVDYGAPRPGLIPLRGEEEGARVMVQIKSPPRGHKGAMLESRPSLPGRLIAYTPHRPGLNFSKIIDQAQRGLLKTILSPKLSPMEGAVVRSAARAADPVEIVAELESLRRAWRMIEETADKAAPPALLFSKTRLSRLAALYPEAGIFLDDPALLDEIEERPGPVRVHLGADALDALQDEDEAFDAALAPVAPLGGGAALVFSQTPGAIVIDIDAGSLPAREANRRAAPAIARHLRLRNLSGHILIDVIPGGKDGPKLFIDALRQSLDHDPVETHILGATRLGMVEMTRARLDLSLAEIMLKQTAPELSDAALAGEALRLLVAEAAARPGIRHGLRVSPELMIEFERRPAMLSWAQKRLGAKPMVIADARIHRFEIETQP